MKKIISIFIFMLLIFILSSCDSFKVLYDSELRDLKYEYDTLVDKKEALEEELANLEMQYQNYPLQIEEIKKELASIDKELEDTYSLFYTLENETLKGAVIVTHYLYDESGWGIFSKEEVVSGSLGSGFVIKEDASHYYILTNNHVINSTEVADKEAIYVYDYNLNQYTAILLFTSADYDMALVRIDKDSSLDSLNVMKMADKNPSKGDDVIAIGQPRGQVNSISIGSINGYVSITPVTYPVIYHSAWIDHGNSGGMLLNIDLEVIGINTWGGVSNSYTNHESLASPIEKIKEFLTNNSFTL